MRHRLSLIGFVILLIALIGCGGGSGPGGPTGLNYRTNWTLNGSPGQLSGQSQRITVRDMNGVDVTNAVLRNPSAGTESVNFSIASGNYQVIVQLFSGSNADGTLIGEIRKRISLSGSMTMNSAVGTAISSIEVSPTNATVQVGRGEVFVAGGLNSAGTSTFIAPSSLNWTALGGVGTVTSDGSFSATATGSGTVRATYSPLAMNGSALVTTTPSGATKKKWTILVFLNAANDLQSFSQLNVNQMEQVASNPDVRIVVQWKNYPTAFSGGLFDGTRRYLVKPDTTSAIASEMLQDMGTTVDMGSPQTLNQFIQWGKANYPADRYGIVIWNHGNGWLRSPAKAESRAVSYDDERGTSIQIWDLNQAFGSEQFDFIAWDCSLMQMFEVAYEIRGNTKYVVGSEESPPGEGYPYQLVFNKFRDNPDDTTFNLCKGFVDGPLAVTAYQLRKITQSVLDTSQFAPLATALSTFGTELNTNSVALTSLITSTRSSAQSFSPTSTRHYRDLLDVAKRIELGTTLPGVLSSITALKSAAANAIVYEGHNSNSANATGLAIDFSPASTFNAADSLGNVRATDYAKLKLAQDTQWNEFLTIAP
jgi:hypothetical protein